MKKQPQSEDPRRRVINAVLRKKLNIKVIKEILNNGRNIPGQKRRSRPWSELVAKRLSNDDDFIADVTGQATIVFLAQSADACRAEDSTGYFLGLIANKTRDLARKHVRRNVTFRFAADEEQIEDAESIDIPLYSRYPLHQVRHAMARLPIMDRRVIELTALGLNGHEIAKALGVTEERVYGLRHRALKKLLAMFNDERDKLAW